MSTPSPCTNVCVIDRRSGWCKGCGRSIDEITRWPLAGESERAAIAAALPGRRAAMTKGRRRWSV